MDYKSKTQKKKDAHSLQELGEKLVQLPAEQIKDIGLPGEVYDAVTIARSVKSRGALKRQMQYIGTLMRKIDPEPIREALLHIEQGNYRRAMAFKEIEKWRDELMAGNKRLLEEILKKCPHADRQTLTQLVRNSIRERDRNKPPRSFRALFRYLNSVRCEQSER